jgi:hypothetical protein
VSKGERGETRRLYRPYDYQNNQVLASFRGKMLLENKTTRHLPIAPKLKEIKIGEVSSREIVRQLVYIPMQDPVIKKIMKRVFNHPLAFGDIEERIGSKIVLPQWGDIFNRISREEYLEYVPHSDPNVRALNEWVFPNL